MAGRATAGATRSRCATCQGWRAHQRAGGGGWPEQEAAAHPRRKCHVHLRNGSATPSVGLPGTCLSVSLDDFFGIRPGIRSPSLPRVPSSFIVARRFCIASGHSALSQWAPTRRRWIRAKANGRGRGGPGGQHSRSSSWPNGCRSSTSARNLGRSRPGDRSDCPRNGCLLLYLRVVRGSGRWKGHTSQRLIGATVTGAIFGLAFVVVAAFKYWNSPRAKAGPPPWRPPGDEGFTRRRWVRQLWLSMGKAKAGRERAGGAELGTRAAAASGHCEGRVAAALNHPAVCGLRHPGWHWGRLPSEQGGWKIRLSEDTIVRWHERHYEPRASSPCRMTFARQRISRRATSWMRNSRLRAFSYAHKSWSTLRRHGSGRPSGRGASAKPTLTAPLAGSRPSTRARSSSRLFAPGRSDAAGDRPRRRPCRPTRGWRASLETSTPCRRIKKQRSSPP